MNFSRKLIDYIYAGDWPICEKCQNVKFEHLGKWICLRCGEHW